MITENSVITKPTVISILKNVSSGIGLDVAKNHTGITIWNGETTETYGFELEPYDKESPFAEYKMRRDFKKKLSEVVEGRHFEYAIIEDVYGGENFDTTRKLLALNTVIDELIFERVCTVDKFRRWNEPTWMKACRTLYKQRGKLKSKLEVQGILEFLEWDFYLEHKDDKPAQKKNIFFEDICDSCGMLLAVVAQELMDINVVKASSIRMSDVKMFYIEDLADSYAIKDKKVCEEGFIGTELDFRHLEKSILAQVMQHPNDVLCAFLPSSKLGVFGTKHNFKFYDSEESYLIFYRK
jgi:hypothetical protein